MASVITLAQLNGASREEFAHLLDGTYEHSPWIAMRAWERRPFSTLAALKQALVATVRDSSREEQLQLIRSHPSWLAKPWLRKR